MNAVIAFTPILAVLAVRGACYLHRVGIRRAWLRLTLRLWSWRTYGLPGTSRRKGHKP